MRHGWQHPNDFCMAVTGTLRQSVGFPGTNNFVVHYANRYNKNTIEPFPVSACRLISFGFGHSNWITDRKEIDNIFFRPNLFEIGRQFGALRINWPGTTVPYPHGNPRPGMECHKFQCKNLSARAPQPVNQWILKTSLQYCTRRFPSTCSVLCS